MEMGTRGGGLGSKGGREDRAAAGSKDGDGDWGGGWE